MDLLGEFFVIEDKLLIHEDPSAFLRFVKIVKRESSAAVEIIAQAYANQSPCRV